MPAKPVELFIAYARSDEPLKDLLLKHLSPLRRSGLIQEWHDRCIEPGADWEHEIDRHLNGCGIILLLISADFIHSEYCYGVEMRQALGRHERGEATLFPIILRPCDWQALPVRKLQALPQDGKPVTTWPNQDEAFTNIARGIRITLGSACISESQPARSHSQPDPAGVPRMRPNNPEERTSINQTQRSGVHSTNIQAGRDINIDRGKDKDSR